MCFTEENGLPPRKHDLFSVLEQKNETSVFAQSRLFHLAEVDNTVPAGAKEHGAVQPTFAVRERALDENLAAGKMADRKILVGFEKRNVLDPHEHVRFFLDCHYKRHVQHDPCQPIAALNGRQSLTAGDVNRAALVDQIQQARETLLQSAPVERDRFVSHLYQARRAYRRTCETAAKSATPTLATNRPGKRQKRSARLWSEELGGVSKN